MREHFTRGIFLSYDEKIPLPVVKKPLINPTTKKPIVPFGSTYRRIPSLVAPRPPAGVLSNIGSSCYLDSVLIALFLGGCPFIDNKILYRRLPAHPSPHYHQCDINPDNNRQARKKIQDTLRELVGSIRHTNDTQYCSNLRQAISMCSSSAGFHQEGQQDAGEFLTWLFSVFGLTYAKTREVKFARTSRKFIEQYNRVERNARNIFTIDGWNLQRLEKRGKSVHIRTLLTTADYSGIITGHADGIQETRTFLFLEDAKYLVFNVLRIDTVYQRVINLHIYPQKTLTLKRGCSLELKSIVCYDGDIDSGHYVCYVKAHISDTRQGWYFYDDLRAELNRCTWEQMVGGELEYDPCTRGVLYFYG